MHVHTCCTRVTYRCKDYSQSHSLKEIPKGHDNTNNLSLNHELNILKLNFFLNSLL